MNEIIAYSELLEMYKKIRLITSVNMIVGWDARTGMPHKAGLYRGEMLGLIGKIEHEYKTNPRIGELLQQIDEKQLDEIQKRDVELIQREFSNNTKISSKLQEEKNALTIEAQQAWQKARAEDNFDIFLPVLEKIIDNTRKIALSMDPLKSPYDVWLDFYEPGMTTAKYDELFSKLKKETIELLQKINEKQQTDPSILQKKISINSQMKITDILLDMYSFDRNAGRVDTSPGPFTVGIGNDDTRMTVRYNEDNFTDALFSIAHETGHALYQQHLKTDLHPSSDYCSYGIHESQSRFYENILCRSYEFWEFFLPKLKKLTRKKFSHINPEEIYGAINHVESSLIRVTADEVTYNLHIILRYELERDLLNRKIKVQDLPELWNSKMQEYLGIVPKNLSEGVLQDMQWVYGMFGYFPTYALANIYAVQFMYEMEKSLKDWKYDLKKGDFSNINKWLQENIHEKGNLYNPIQLVEKITGNKPDTKYLLEYLNTKYV